jgi:3-phenylpropionate/trans-cinnamate dioxygenase ferredoxin reductase subunit
MSDTTVIIGAGQAGSDVAMSLRQLKHEGRIVLLGDEAAVPYRRPPLSKDFLSGEIPEDKLYIRPRDAYARHNVELITGKRAVAIDRKAHTVQLSDGSALEYGKLVLATGGRPRLLPLAGADKPNVHYIRTLEDINRLKEQFQPGRRLVIIGGGYIGLEAAAVGAKKSLSITLVEALPRLLARVAGTDLSGFYEQVHRAHGVDIRLGAGVIALEGGNKVETVVLQDGSRIGADLVIVGIGLIPNTELAEQAGLDCDNGILVDLYARTSDPDIVAAGDCTNHENGFLGRRIRLESVPNATEQGRVAAATLCGQQTPYTAVPWFWSDQYDLKLQTAGVSQGHDQVVLRGTTDGNSFVVFYLKAGVVIALDAVNRPRDYVLGKKMVAERLSPAAASLADESVELKTLLT